MCVLIYINPLNEREKMDNMKIMFYRNKTKQNKKQAKFFIQIHVTKNFKCQDENTVLFF